MIQPNVDGMFARASASWINFITVHMEKDSLVESRPGCSKQKQQAAVVVSFCIKLHLKLKYRNKT
jgi:hypothetical protein